MEQEVFEQSVRKPVLLLNQWLKTALVTLALLSHMQRHHTKYFDMS